MSSYYHFRLFTANIATNQFYCDIRSMSILFRTKILHKDVAKKEAMQMKPRSSPPGTKNIVGSKVLAIRRKQGLKQKDFLARLQVLGMEISATGLSRLEGQYRLVQDFEVVILAKVLGISTDQLLDFQ